MSWFGSTFDRKKRAIVMGIYSENTNTYINILPWLPWITEVQKQQKHNDKKILNKKQIRMKRIINLLFWTLVMLRHLLGGGWQRDSGFIFRIIDLFYCAYLGPYARTSYDIS